MEINWDYCQRNSDEILLGGLERLRAARPHDSSRGLPSGSGNYVIWSDSTPLYIGEARDLSKRLRQQFRTNTSTFYKNYKKDYTHLGAEHLLPINEFTVTHIRTRIGRKEIEEFGIVNLPAPLNKFQLGKREISTKCSNSNIWSEVQNQYTAIIEDGSRTILSSESICWTKATPVAGPGLYIIFNPNDEIIYVGESSNVAKRHKTHSTNTYFSALRRNLGTRLKGFHLQERKGKKRYFEPQEDARIDEFLLRCRIISQQVSFGRFELEEYLIRTIQPILNKKSKQPL
ncbi:MAG: GIY-YIG nuclease family protein [candidate division Zixibacteria bacterium]|nr:GIY-YIG nuclease family protein [candidate division Zixibacteria bacterium]